MKQVLQEKMTTKAPAKEEEKPKGKAAEELDKARMREAQRLFKLKPRAKKKKAVKKVEGNQSALVGATFGDVVGVAGKGTRLARLMRSGVA